MFYVLSFFPRERPKLLEDWTRTHGTPYESLKSAFRWAEEAHGDDELLSMLRASVAVRSRSRSAECERDDWCCSLWQASRSGWQVLPEKRPFSSSVLKVLAVQRRNVCAQVGRRPLNFFWLLVV